MRKLCLPVTGRAVCWMACALVCLGLAAPAAAEVIHYHITVQTADGAGSGTDNPIYVKLHGAFGHWTHQFELKGHHEASQIESFVFTYEDIGIIDLIEIDVDGWLDDRWSPYVITILRGTETDDKANANGWSDFPINRQLGYAPETFTGRVTRAKVTISPTGEAQEDTQHITIVHFANNPSEKTPQEVLRFKETWSTVDRVLVSATQQTELGVHATLTYESPELAVGKFTAEAGVAWKSVLTNIRESERQNIVQREFDWVFTAPPGSAVFRRQEFDVPYADRVFRASDGGSRIVRAVHGEIRPSGISEFLYVPRIVNNQVSPIPLAELESRWLQYMPNRESLDFHIKNWIRSGWVVDEKPPVLAPPSNTRIVR